MLPSNLSPAPGLPEAQCRTSRTIGDANDRRRSSTANMISRRQPLLRAMHNSSQSRRQGQLMQTPTSNTTQAKTGTAMNPRPQHSTAIPPDWRSRRSATMTLRGLQDDTSTWDLYNTFSKYGSVVYIEIDERPSKASRAARVKFEPPPRNTDFFQQGRCRLPGVPGSYMAWIEFHQQGDVDRPITTPTGNSCPETITLGLSGVTFGFLLEPTVVMAKRSIRFRPAGSKSSPDLVADFNCPAGLTVDFKRKKIVMNFSINLQDAAVSAISLHRFRAGIKFTNIKDMFAMRTSDGSMTLIITVCDPPPFWKLRTSIRGTFHPGQLVWGDKESWARAVDIRFSTDPLSGPVSLEEDAQYIDIGRWTTYWLSISESSADLLGVLGSSLKDWNISIRGGSAFRLVPNRQPNLWQVLRETEKQVSFGNSTESQGHALGLLCLGPLGPLPFDVRYQLEVCISHGVLSEYNIEHEFIAKLAELSQVKIMGISRARLVLEFAADRGGRVYRPMSLFSDREAMEYTSISAYLPNYCVLMRKIIITPTRVYYNTPTVETTNRVIRHYKNVQDNFIRVQFVDEILEGRIAGCEADIFDHVYERAYRVLNHGLKMGNVHWRFLAFGNSQIRESGAFFFHQAQAGTDVLVTCESIRGWMGRLGHITVVAKYAARLGQCLSTTRPVSAIITPRIIKLPDVERGKFCFTDGVGKISPQLAGVIGRDWDVFPPPSAVQFRMGGCKGVLVAWPEVKGAEVHIRKSQEKFSAEFNGLEVIRCSRFASATLNRQTITILSSLGVPDEVFVDMMAEQLSNYEEAMTDTSQAADLLSRYIDENLTTKVMEEMIRNGFMESHEPFMQTILQLWKFWSIKALKEKAKLIVEKGAFVLGGIDETGMLRGHSKQTEGAREVSRDLLPQIFLQVSCPTSQGKCQVITGVCLVGRNPSLHPGDIRVVEAVDVPPLHHVKNVVLFPLQGDRDLPGMCSGGDLDGDDFFVIWDDRLIPKEWGHTPMGFSPPRPVDEKGGPTVDGLKEFFVLFMKNNTLPMIAHAHLATADYEEGGPKHEKCLELAKLHSAAVDYVKTGVRAEWSRNMEPRKWPHFMEKNPKATYHSTSALGQLYDMADGRYDAFDVKEEYKSPFDKRILKRFKLDNDMLKAARRLKSQYDIAMRRVMGQLEVRTEFEVWTGFVMSKPRVGSSYKIQEKVCQECRTLKKLFQDMCIKAAGGSRDVKILGRFVAAMYQVTSEEVRIALHEARQFHVRQDGTVGKRRISARSMPLMSFPWLFPEILGEIVGGAAAKGRMARHEGYVDNVLSSAEVVELGQDSSGDAAMDIDDDLDDCTRTSDGKIIHRGEILNLFHNDDGDELVADDCTREAIRTKSATDSAAISPSPELDPEPSLPDIVRGVDNIQLLSLAAPTPGPFGGVHSATGACLGDLAGLWSARQSPAEDVTTLRNPTFTVANLPGPRDAAMKGTKGQINHTHIEDLGDLISFEDGEELLDDNTAQAITMGGSNDTRTKALQAIDAGSSYPPATMPRSLLLVGEDAVEDMWIFSSDEPSDDEEIVEQVVPLTSTQSSKHATTTVSLDLPPEYIPIDEYVARYNYLTLVDMEDEIMKDGIDSGDSDEDYCYRALW